MGIDWRTVADSMNTSLEAQLARRDMTKQQAMLNNVMQQYEQKRQFEAEQKLRQEQMQENVRLREEAEADRRSREAAMVKERENDNKRALYGQLTGGRKPGDKFRQPAIDLIKEFEGGADDYTQDPNDPLIYVYKQAEAQKALAVAQAQEAVRAAQEKRAQEDQKLQLAKEEREKKEFAQRQKDRDLTIQKKQKQLDALDKAAKDGVASIPVHLRPGIKARFDQLVKEGHTIVPWDDEVNKAELWIKAVQDVQQQAQGAGQMPPGPLVRPPVKAPEQQMKSIDDIKRAFPGAKITPIK